MSMARWSSRFETGIEHLDAQHQALFAAVNRLTESFRAGASQEEVQACLTFLVQYTVDHFETEEQFMRAEGYPELEPHRQEHQRLMAQVHTLQSRFEQGETLSIDVAIFLADWLTHHIEETDMGYVRYTKAKRLDE
jgi:hemerythrin